MNKASAKEPSMDEILSSIRQIIADDDAGLSAAPLKKESKSETVDADAIDEMFEAKAIENVEVEAEDEDALTLSTDQIVEAEMDEAMTASDPELDAEAVVEIDTEAAADDDLDAALESFGLDDMVEPDDIAFDLGDAEEETPEPDISAALAEVDAGLEEMSSAPQEEPASPLPDPNLSSEIAEKLLEPATSSAVKSNFAKLSHIAMGAQNITIENMVREMLRPLLKEWLDENLPSVVEKMVEKEIERISRGN